jgi:hypothetical protein
MKLSEALECVEHAIAANVPAHLSGAPGIGKTEGTGNMAARRDWLFYSTTLSTMESVDMRGLPKHGPDDSVIWNVPDFIKTLRDMAAAEPGRIIVWLIDEITALKADVQIPCMQLIRERHIGPHWLPETVRIVTAGNRQSDRAAAQRMGTALANRLLHFDVDSPATPEGVQEWCQWAAQNDIPPIMLAFIMLRGAATGAEGAPGYQPGMLHHFDPNNAAALAFPTPRSVVSASKFCDLPKGIRHKMMKAACGEIFAAEFEGFAEVYSKLPSPLAIASNPAGAAVPEKAPLQYAIAMALARYAKPGNFAALLQYMGRVGTAFSVAMVTEALRRTPDLTDTPAFIQWRAANPAFN